jgi:hypothetical protein
LLPSKMTTMNPLVPMAPADRHLTSGALQSESQLLLSPSCPDHSHPCTRCPRPPGAPFPKSRSDLTFSFCIKSLKLTTVKPAHVFLN